MFSTCGRGWRGKRFRDGKGGNEKRIGKEDWSTGR
jgi:hypothetical protein